MILKAYKISLFSHYFCIIIFFFFVYIRLITSVQQINYFHKKYKINVSYRAHCFFIS